MPLLWSFSLLPLCLLLRPVLLTLSRPSLHLLSLRVGSGESLMPAEGPHCEILRSFCHSTLHACHCCWVAAWAAEHVMMCIRGMQQEGRQH